MKSLNKEKTEQVRQKYNLPTVQQLLTQCLGKLRAFVKCTLFVRKIVKLRSVNQRPRHNITNSQTIQSTFLRKIFYKAKLFKHISYILFFQALQ